ncbi:two-component system response regulator [candidate division KSB3 bacterium]|uniref:Two-component system response regulator n=1 Tax=candidate division KSB3 bacterium TaxID=2044937 RepID=A0A2G6E2J6_9BACT|nr:MAG: two-component system response regulator [candidate division KSB3 bacterium]PIE28869.1 MAG: two-component system response regulator [candidate division KSB3 bacterium]
MLKLTGMNILLVDDTPDNLYVMESVLEEQGYNIFQAASGPEALFMLTQRDFDLVLLDVQMPEMDGFEVAQLMKGNSKTKDVAIIFITALSKEIRHIQKGYDVGAENYLFKPIEPDELRKKVEVSLKYRRFKKIGEQR